MTKSELNPAKSALVVIDLQKGVVGMPTEPRSPGEVVQNARRLADGLRAKGALIVLVKVSFSPDAKDRLLPTCDLPATAAGKRPDDWADLVPEMAPQPSDHV